MKGHTVPPSRFSPANTRKQYVSTRGDRFRGTVRFAWIGDDFLIETWGMSRRAFRRRVAREKHEANQWASRYAGAQRLSYCDRAAIGLNTEGAL